MNAAFFAHSIPATTSKTPDGLHPESNELLLIRKEGISRKFL